MISTASFTIVGLRRDAGAAPPGRRSLFRRRAAGRPDVVAKRVGQAVLNFPAGSQHASTQVQATVRVNRGVATLPQNVRDMLTRPRKAGEAEAAQ